MLTKSLRAIGYLLGLFAILVSVTGIIGISNSIGLISSEGSIIPLIVFAAYVIYGLLLLVPFRILRRIIPLWVFALLTLVFCIRIPFGFANVVPIRGQVGLITILSSTVILLAIAQLLIYARKRRPEQDVTSDGDSAPV